MSRILNFSAGPATLPEDVLLTAQAEMLDYNGCGMSIMEVSHRGPQYAEIHEQVKANIKELAGLNDDYAVLFMGGGATTQFALAPMNLCGKGQSMDYTNTGAWAKKAIAEAKIQGQVQVVADTSGAEPACMPDPASIATTEDAAYLHITTNETIAGTQWKAFPGVNIPLVADMSSDIFSRPLDVAPFGMIYAGAQKNLGPAGVTLVIIRKDLAERVSDSVPQILRYKSHIEKDSLLNTPPSYPVYLLKLVTDWLLEKGGLSAMEKHNKTKAGKLYELIDSTDFYQGTAALDSRSLMNVTFRLPSEELEAQFVKEAASEGMSGLKGHRSVGGIRASIYNAFPSSGVDTLISFMKEFQRTNG